MAYKGVFRALYDHETQPKTDAEEDAELAIKAGDLLYIVDKDDENWWRARKKATDDDEDEPEGLVPSNYVKEAEPVDKARALFEYTRQTEEELSFLDGATLLVFDTSDPDWTLAGLDGDFGFVPSNYIELFGAREITAPDRNIMPPALPARVHIDVNDSCGTESSQSLYPYEPVAVTIASAVQGRLFAKDTASPPPPEEEPDTHAWEVLHDAAGEGQPARPAQLAASKQSSRGSSDRFRTEQPARQETLRATFQPDDDGPTRGYRVSYRDSHLTSHRESPTENKQDGLIDELRGKARLRESMVEASPGNSFQSPGGFHLYNINEMVSVLGKKKKMPSTLGINIATRMILIAPERVQDGPPQEWSSDKMTHYSREGKHVFLELVRPSRSIDFHAGAKDTAEEIVSALGELAGILRADALRDVIMADDLEQKKGIVLYGFMAQGDDEVTVGAGDEVIVLDDTKSEEWWSVRGVKNGKEGVVPSSYIEVTGPVTPTTVNMPPSSTKSTIEANRLEEKRLANEAAKSGARDASAHPRHQPRRRDSSGNNNHGSREGSGRKPFRPKPDQSQLRTWTDRSKSFSVEAQFLGIRDAKVNLHKANGVKIAVPVAKMSVDDLEYIECVTGMPLTADKGSNRNGLRSQEQPGSRSAKIGASIEQSRKPEYDWFQFFLSCEVAVGLCERYAQAFIRDSMDESVLPDVDTAILRTLGLKEGDILKVMRVLDTRFGRTGKRIGATGSGNDGGTGGLFAGPGGTLRNNTKKGRPAPAVQTSGQVDPAAFTNGSSSEGGGDVAATPLITSNLSEVSATADANEGAKTGFDDDAWDVKPANQSAPVPTPILAQLTTSSEKLPARNNAENVATTRNSSPAALTKTMSASMQELSLLTQPLQPNHTRDTTAQPLAATSSQEVPSAPAPAPSANAGASPAFFAGVSQQNEPRQRPLAPQATGFQNTLVPPPPQRPLSAPQSAQSSAFGPPPLMPQMTGYISTNYQPPVAPPGQSLGELGQLRFQQQQQVPQGQAQMPQMTGYSQTQPMIGPTFARVPILTGDRQQQQFLQSLQPQQTGAVFPGAFPTPQPFEPMMTGSISSYLPPALEAQRAGAMALQFQPTGFSGYDNAAQLGDLPSLQLLQPQKTGPPPDVRFGVTPETRRLTSLSTGRRANLSQATPDNPFGF